MTLKQKDYLTPFLVEKHKDGTFILVEGYRRYFAFKHIGKTDVDCIISTGIFQIKRKLNGRNFLLNHIKRSMMKNLKIP